MRHSTGTLLLEDEDEHNFDSVLKVIQERLGHSHLSTTSDIYVHPYEKGQEENCRVKKKTAGKYNEFSRKSLANQLGEKSKLRRIK
ncbi:hypothetical protein M3664_01745 [Paenibacillus lautus]|nr:hypothetical protein [Paenibacillus lautus]MCM3256495.1 hypothetical protein [Paenibacillus lautus]